jgi:5-bromo-4-chloroindolyl phosphate hydrolysis protein
MGFSRREYDVLRARLTIPKEKVECLRQYLTNESRLLMILSAMP